jgi:hypothetical protein
MSIDWRAIERAFRDGVSLRVICDKYGVSYGDIFAKAKAEGWTRSAGGAPPQPPDRRDEDNEPEAAPAERLPALIDRNARDATRASQRI